MRTSIGAAALFVTTLVTAQEKVPGDLQALVDAERAFAKTATVKGLRDSFLDYFADDSIALTPDPVPAKDRLRAQPSQPFSVLEITWEPRTGDIAASGELGWLTGPSTIIDHAASNAAPRYGNYLSVWRKQPDGAWRVYIDIGVPTPELPAFAPGFTRASPIPRYSGAEGKVAATRALVQADREVNDRIATLGPGKAYLERLTPDSRLHRPGVLPIVGSAAIAAWLTDNAASMAAKGTTAEASAAGDLGYSYGTYALKPAAPEPGAYLRVWTRDQMGKWLIAAEVIK
jgi:ketosteroid isomerase-like protein